MKTISDTPPPILNHFKGKGTRQESTSPNTTQLTYPPLDIMAARSFEAVMTEVTRPMPVRQRLFSQMIHARAISTISDIAGSTIARPNALLLGAVLSFTLTLSTYLLAKNLGYSLSGSESVGAFVFGWLLGLIYDFLKLMITGKR